MAERKPMKRQDVNQEPFPDPNEPKGRHAGLTLALVIGSIFLVMIITLVSAFIYFNTSGTPAGSQLPDLLAYVAASLA